MLHEAKIFPIFLCLLLPKVFSATTDGTEVIIPVLNVTTEYVDVPLNTSLYLSCIGNRRLAWEFKYPQSGDTLMLSAHNEIVSGSPESRVFQSIIRLDLNTYENTGRYSCYYNGTTQAKSASLYIFVNDNQRLLLPAEEYFITADEDQELVIPCLVTNSKASVTLWRGKCEEESVPTDNLRYDPTAGFVIAHATSYFSDHFCCQARLDELLEDKVKFHLMYIAKTNFAPLVHVETEGSECVELNSSFTLTCVIVAEADTMLESVWSHPVTDAERVQISDHRMKFSRNEGMHSGYEDKLTVMNVQEEDEGYYNCSVADHSAKANYSQVYVKVCAPSGAPSADSNHIIIPIVAVAGCVFFLITVFLLKRRFWNRKRYADLDEVTMKTVT